jgi:hypothetical protein
VTPRQLRALRGTAAAWIATIIAATSHTLAGGGAPAPLLVAALGILAAPLSVSLIGRRLSVWRIGVTVLASQALFHLAFALTAGADPAAAAGHVHTLSLGGAAALALPDAPMVAAHVLAGVATVAALVGGERMLRALGRGIRSLLSRADDPAGYPVARCRIAPARLGPRPRGVVLSDLSPRGPPLVVIAVG